MDIRATQELAIQFNDIERRMPDQFSTLNVRANKNGQNNGDLHYVNANNKRKVSYDVQAQNNRPNFQQYPQHKDSKTADEKERKDLLKPGDIVKNRWCIMYKIGGGGFGEIYQATDTQVSVPKPKY